MGALLDACFQDTGPSEAEAAQLAAFHARQLAAAGPEEPSHTRVVHHHQPTAAADGRASHDAEAEAAAEAEASAEAAMYDSDDVDDAACSRPQAPSERPRGRGRGRS
jgi:hypothetical protein